MKTKLFTLLVALFATTNLWAYDFQCGDFYYNIINTSQPHEVEVTYGNIRYSGEITIPSMVIHEGINYSVTGIGRNAFNNCTSLSACTIPNSVTSIGESAFQSCSSLTSIIIPNSVISIGWRAFGNCCSLSTITIPSTVTHMENNPFFYCSSLVSIVVENGNNKYDSRDNCNAIIETNSNTLISSCQNTIIPNSVTSIESDAFSGCSSLISVTIPNSVTSIGDGSFSGCSSLKSIIVDSGNINYDSRDNCNAIIATNSNTLISGCQNTIIPNSVTSIGNSAFSGCSSLTSITIPNSVTSIGDDSFSECSSLTSVTIPNSITSIGKRAFQYCSSLTSISIPNSITSIGYNAFGGTPWLDSQPDGMLYIGKVLYAYIGKIPNNAELVIREGTTMVSDRAFPSSSIYDSIASITIPKSIIKFGEGALFQNLIKKIIYLGDLEDWCRITITRSSLYPWKCVNELYINNKKITDLAIPNTIDSISYAFYACSSIKSLCIHKNLKYIDYNAFYNCPITTVYVNSKTPPTLGPSYCSNCDRIFNSNPVCYIPCGTTSDYFSSSWKNNVSSFEEYPAPFYEGTCGETTYWTFANETLFISGEGKMYDNMECIPWAMLTDSIKKIEIANGVTHIGSNAFRNLNKTTEVIIGNSIVEIGEHAFADCNKLNKVTIGYGVEKISKSTFANCRMLFDIYCYATLPPEADESSFMNYNAYLYIPCESDRYYKSDMIFSKFQNINCIGSDNVVTDDVVITPSINDVTIIWPTESNADTYTIVIKKGDDVFCTLTFNAEGQLLNIAFAPSRNSNNHYVQYAEQTTNGYRFTVTGLEEGTRYTYNIDVKDAASKTIKSHSGEFITESMTAVDNITTNNMNIQKLIRNGQFIILRDGKTYNVTGQMIK